MAKTKRRKVLVTFHEIGSVTHLTRKSAVRGVALSPIGRATEKAVPFVETRPGDVVLSREQVRLAHECIDRLAVLVGSANYQARCLAIILRGGR